LKRRTNQYRIRNCSKAFGEIHAIDHVSMEIGERQIFGLVGTNGAGKSTLLRMAGRVIKQEEVGNLGEEEQGHEYDKKQKVPALIPIMTRSCFFIPLL